MGLAQRLLAALDEPVDVSDVLLDARSNSGVRSCSPLNSSGQLSNTDAGGCSCTFA